MGFLKEKQFKEYLLLICFGGIILFICVNSTEAKKLISYSLSVLSPLIYGFVIAFILNLFVKIGDSGFSKLAKKRGKKYDSKKHRMMSIIISLVVLLLFIGLTIGLIIPNLKNTFESLYKEAPALWDKFLSFIDSIKTKQPKLEKYITGVEGSLDTYFDKLIAKLKGNVGNILSSALSTIKSASNVLVNFFIGLIIAFGVVYKKEEIVKEFKLILRRSLNGRNYKTVSYVLKMANEKFQIYFKFNFIQAAITGVGTLIFMLVCRMPHVVSIALLITVTQLIPIVGAIIGTAVGAILILPISFVKAIIFVVLSILVQQIVEKVINPHLIGKELEMPGMLTFLSIIIGGKQFGLIGLFCAVPFVSIIYDIYRYDLRPRLYSKKEKNQNE